MVSGYFQFAFAVISGLLNVSEELRSVIQHRAECLAKEWCSHCG